MCKPPLVQLTQIRLREGELPQPSSIPAKSPHSGDVLQDRLSRRVKYLRLSLTDRCNYRCTYCLPDGIQQALRKDLLSLEEIQILTAEFARWGVERVRLTGGEPTLRRGLPDLIRGLAKIETPKGPLHVSMTTNGHRLDELAPELADAGLRSLTVSLDSLRADRFEAITRRGAVDKVIAGIEAASRAGFDSLKLNIVAIKGFNEDEIGAIAKFCWDREVLPRFIELMPMSAGELFVPGNLMTASEVRETIARECSADLADDSGSADPRKGVGPATYRRLTSGPYSGKVFGTIAAMTENFCDSCNRLRISAVGQLQACLAHDDAGDLRSALRSGNPSLVEEVVRNVLGAKRDSHAFELNGTGGPTKSMISIGG